MERRKFIFYSGMASLGILTRCNITAEEEQKVKDFILAEMTISEMQRKMMAGELSSLEIVKLYLDRIEKVDQSGPHLNSIIELNPEAMKIAEQMDLERKKGNMRGPLHGIPIVVKDNIDTGDNMQTTAGALAMVGHKANEDAHIIKLIRSAGMILLGKTNLSEWANFRSTKSVSGWSSRGGQTHNPYVLTQNPCGSSSGSGVSIAANLCAVSIGTETDGSVTCPAAVCGIVGIKPTIGLVSRTGIIPISSSQDTAGPMARTVEDAAALLNVLVDFDSKDEVTIAADNYKSIDYTVFLNKDGLKGKRLGHDFSQQSEDESLNQIRDQIIQELKDSGAIIVDVKYKHLIDEIGDKEYNLMMYEFKDGLNKYLSNTNAPVKSLEEVIDFNLENRDKAMPHFQQEILISSQAKGDLNTPEYLELASTIKKKAQNAIDGVINENNLDGLFGLTIGPGCDTNYETGDKWADVYTPPAAAIAGYAHITVPGGFIGELPIGLSIFSGAYTEGPLIEMAYAYEQSTHHRKRPLFLPQKPEMESHPQE